MRMRPCRYDTDWFGGKEIPDSQDYAQALSLLASTTPIGHMPALWTSCLAFCGSRHVPVFIRVLLGSCLMPRSFLITQFVQLHSEPLLQHLYDGFKQQYPGITFPPPPQTGTLRLDDVLRSTYFFS